MKTIAEYMAEYIAWLKRVNRDVHGIGDNLSGIGDLIRTQDNRITYQPIFVVEKSVMIITDPDYGYDEESWVSVESGNYETASEHTARRLDILSDWGRSTGKWKKFYRIETWEFVTCCFTEQGCLDYLKLNGHNLGKTRIYVYGSYRNEEYRTVRSHLISLSAKGTAP